MDPNHPELPFSHGELISVVWRPTVILRKLQILPGCWQSYSVIYLWPYPALKGGRDLQHLHVVPDYGCYLKVPEGELPQFFIQKLQ